MAGPKALPLMESADDVLLINRVFEVPRALLFRLWTSQEHVVRWWGPEGMHLSHCEMDARPGGHWRFCMTGHGVDHWIHGTYRQVTPPERLVFTYTNDADGHAMLVSIDFIDLGARTEMRFRQETFFSVNERNGHNWGWNSSFDLLAGYLTGPHVVDLFGREALGRRDEVAEDRRQAGLRHSREERVDADHAEDRRQG